jgi:DNA modification methylase
MSAPKTPYYSHAGIQIFHGDCRLILPTLPKCDLLLTDPPYGIGASREKFGGHGVLQHHTGLAKGKCIAKRDYGDAAWDDIVCDDSLIELCRSRADNHAIWGGNYFTLPPTKGILVWDKLRGDTDFADGEMCWTNASRALRIFRYRWNGFLVDPTSTDDRSHPTQKPLALMKWVLSLFPDAKTVLDPFCGSGTTLVAAKAMGLTAVGIELHEPYCEIAAKRLSQEVFDWGETA